MLMGLCTGEHVYVTVALQTYHCIGIIKLCPFAGLEYVNGMADTGVQLEGWSNTVLAGIDDYDSVFEDLYNKYKDRVAVSPEVKLVFMVGTSAAM
jgi:hypothetical protein